MMQGVIAAAKAEGCKTLELIPYPQKGGEEAKARLVACYERHRFKGEEKSPYMSLSLVGPPAGRAQPAL